MMEAVYPGCILIECPNTIFQLYVQNEDELSKVKTFMKNIQNLHNVELIDIYSWCNRQKIAYETRFNFRKGRTLDKTVCAFIRYLNVKRKVKRQLRLV